MYRRTRRRRAAHGRHPHERFSHAGTPAILVDLNTMNHITPECQRR
jgi:hypothetical protein